MIKKWCIENKYSIFISLVLMCFGGYCISKSYGFVLFPDEFGYWNYAAMLTGYDWSDIVSLGSYYSYGYSLILFPIFALCKNAVIAYRIAIAVNVFLLAICFFIWKKMTSRLFGDTKKNAYALYVAIAVLYPSWLFYARTTLSEIVIVTLYAVICKLLYDYLEHNKASTLVLLSVTLVYIHFVHMRTVAVLIACAITLLAYDAVKRRKIKQCLLFAVVLLVVFGAGYELKEWLTGNVYAASSTVNTNDYAGQIGKMNYIFTKEGLRNLVISIAGKMLYLGIASFGLAYWGIWYSLKQLLGAVKNWKAGKEMTVNHWFYLFVLLGTGGATMVNAIYTVSPGRVDALTYGRYHEYMMPILVILGLKELEENVGRWRGVLVITLTEIVMTILVTWSLATYGQTNIHGYMMVGMSYLHQIENFEPISFYWQALGLGIVLTVGITFLCSWVNGHRNMEIGLTLILALELILAIRAGSLYIEESAIGAYRDTKIVEKIEQLVETADREIFYVHDGNYALVSILQFMLRDEDIKILQKEDRLLEKLGRDDLLVTDYRKPLDEEQQKQYESFLENGHFILYYND